MNIYEKLQKARVDLQTMNLKKSGENKFAGFKYYELGDFLPAINKLLLDNKLFSYINFNSESAVLTIVNAEKVDEIVIFTSPLGTLNLKGCNDIQNLGGVQTYLRRYLYMNAFEIVENDEFDATTGKDSTTSNNKQTSEPKKDKITEAQTKRLYAIGKGKDSTAIKEILSGYGYKTSKDILVKDYEVICKKIEEL